jgi:hypothetical protein
LQTVVPGVLPSNTRTLTSEAGGQVQTIDWLNRYCSKTEAKVPRPGNIRAIQENDYVQVITWDCTAVLGPGAVFHDTGQASPFAGQAGTTESQGGPGSSSNSSAQSGSSAGPGFVSRVNSGVPGNPNYLPPPPSTNVASPVAAASSFDPTLTLSAGDRAVIQALARLGDRFEAKLGGSALDAWRGGGL